MAQSDQVKLCAEWIKTFCKPSKTYSKPTSYYFKHRVEEWANTYISNDAFKEACALLRIAHKKAGPNWRVCLKEVAKADTV